MLSFKALSEKKTKVKINPRKEEMMEKMKNNHGEDCDCMKCEKKRRGEDVNDGPDIATEAAKKKDDSYLETDFKKRQKNNEKARKDLMKGPQMKNPHFESKENAYVSQEEVSEESTEEVAETETFLTFGQFTEGKSLSIDDQMRISREAAAKRKPYQPGDRQKQRAAQLRAAAKNAKKDTRTDAQKMTDATGPRPGSRYRGD